MRALFGDVTVRELVLVAVVFGLILLFSWAPRIGEAIGGMGETARRLDGGPRERAESDERDDPP
jgi:hypothetical protein